MITQERLKEVLTYDPTTGIFRWSEKPRSGVTAGAIAGIHGPTGYRIRVDRTSYKAHRLVYLYIHGFLPEGEIDHRNGNPNDNRLSNLRLATHAENMGNAKRRADNTSGRKGVARSSAKTERWRAHFRGKYLGSFKTKDEAHAAYQQAAGGHFGEFARYD